MKRLILMIVVIAFIFPLGIYGGRVEARGYGYYVRIVSPMPFDIVNPFLDLEIEFETNSDRIGQLRYRIGFQKEQSLPFIPSSTSTRYRFTIPSDYLTMVYSDYYVPLRVKIIVLDSKHSWSDPGDVKMVRIPKDLFASLLWIPNQGDQGGYKVIGIKASEMKHWIGKMKSLSNYSNYSEEEIHRLLLGLLLEYANLLPQEKQFYSFFKGIELTEIEVDNRVRSDWKFLGNRVIDDVYDFIRY